MLFICMCTFALRYRVLTASGRRVLARDPCCAGVAGLWELRLRPRKGTTSRVLAEIEQ
jgi:hypothetical protein